MTMKISVDPKVLEAGAIDITDQCSAYETTYYRLYQCIDAVQAVVKQEKDNSTYVNKLHSFEQDFVALNYLMRNYAEFLRLSARAYRITKDKLKSNDEDQ